MSLKIVVSILLFFGSLFLGLQSVVNAQDLCRLGGGPSQMLLAKNASSIVLGTLVYVGHPSELGPSLQPTTSQTLVYQIMESMKGKLDSEFVNVSIEVPSNKPHYLESAFISIFDRHILLLQDKVDEHTCADKILNKSINRYETTKQFKKYATSPCYPLRTQAIIEGSDSEKAAIAGFLKSAI